MPRETVDNAQIEIYTVEGKIVKTIIIDKPQNQIIVNTKGLIPGIYVCSLINNGVVVESTTISVIGK